MRFSLFVHSIVNTIGRPFNASIAYSTAQRETASTIWNYAKANGCSDLDAAALLSMPDGECSFLVNARGDRVNGEPTAGGMCQWHDGRRQVMLLHTGVDVWTAGVTDQCRAWFWEMTTQPADYKRILNLVKTAPTLLAKVTVLVTQFERSRNQDRDIARRYGMATYWLGQFGTTETAK